MKYIYTVTFCLGSILALFNCASSEKEGLEKEGSNRVSSNAQPSGPPAGLNAFVDISHHDTVNLKEAQKAGLAGAFLKATQGSGFTDNTYGDRVKEARELGLLIGAYHFGTAQPVEEQVQHFLDVLNKSGAKGVVPVLDWEDNPVKEEGIMSKEQAAQFIELFYQKTGVYVTVYGGYWMLYQLRDEKDIGSFAKAPLWQAFYSDDIGYLSGIWKDWAFVQYTDGTLGPEPHTFAGIGAVDRDVFNGTPQEAEAFWKAHALTR